MIWTLIILSIMVISVAVLVLDTYIDFLPYGIDDLFVLSGTLSSIALLICIIFILSTHTLSKADIKNSEIEYNTLVKRYELINSEYEDVSASEVIKDIGEWNQKVFRRKHFGYSKWTNWFYSKEYIDSLNYINIGGAS